MRFLVPFFFAAAALFFGSPFVSGAAWWRDYLAHQSGYWADVNTWKQYDGSNWVGPAPAVLPHLDGIIAVRQLHGVTVTAAVTVDQIVMESSQFASSAGASLTITDGSGFDFSMDSKNTAITVAGFLVIESGAWFEAGGGNG